MTAKNYHLVQDCLVGAERACLWASVSAGRLLVWRFTRRWIVLQHRPFPHATHTYILGARVGMFRRESP